MKSNAQKFLLPALAILPGIVVLGAKFVLPMSGPREAAAATSEEFEPFELPPALSVMEQDALLASAFASEMSKGFGSSPLLIEYEPLVDQKPVHVPRVDQAIDGPMLKVTSIMTTSQGPIAVIEGELRKVGDVVVEGWSVLHVDPVIAAVTLQHTSGVRHTVTMKKRGE